VRIATASRAGRRPTKRLDLRDLRAAVEDSRVWSAVGQVIQPDGEAGATHYELVPGESGAIVDILVEVLLLPSNIEVTCRLAGAAGARGAITIPDVGDEVLIVIPNGQVDWMPVLIARLSTNDVPNPVGQGPATGTTVIMDTTVLVHDGTGGAEPVVKLSEHQALAEHVDQHLHAYASPAGAALTSPPTHNVAGTPLDAAPEATGTEVLLAK
jgi:hypothetical protein